jgi:hypothetical protein
MRIKRQTVGCFFIGVLGGLSFVGLVATELQARPDGPPPTTRPRSPLPWIPTERDRFFVWRFPLPPGSGEALPWLRDWLAHPHEVPAPEQPDDVEGGPVGPPPCTNC